MYSKTDTSWHWVLELKLRKTVGNAFQAFFSDVMEARHGDDFVRVKPYGSLGDKGCDGYLSSTGSVFACYGAQNGAAGSVTSFISKMNNDFDKSKKDLTEIMKSWHMTHNIVEGLPTEAIQAKVQLEKDNPTLTFFFFGKPSMLELFSELTESQRIDLIGPHARNSDYFKLQISEVKDLVDAIIKAVDEGPQPTTTIAPVSPEKLEFNALPSTWASVIQGGRLNAHNVKEYFNNHPDPMRGENTAQIFRDQYEKLKAEGLAAGAIMEELYLFIVGPDATTIDRQVAAHSLLSYLFESCDIFENAPTVLGAV